jgi:hypothetical protein
MPIALKSKGTFLPGTHFEPRSFCCQTCASMNQSVLSKSSNPIKVKGTAINQPYEAHHMLQGICSPLTEQVIAIAEEENSKSKIKGNKTLLFIYSPAF